MDNLKHTSCKRLTLMIVLMPSASVLFYEGSHPKLSIKSKLKSSSERMLCHRFPFLKVCQ